MILGVQEITVKAGMQDFERSFFQELFLGHWVPNIHNNNISKNTKRRKKKRWTGKQWLWRMLLECFLDGSMSKSLLHHHTHLCYFSSSHIWRNQIWREKRWEANGSMSIQTWEQAWCYIPTTWNIPSVYCFLWRGYIGSLWLDREDEEALYKFINPHKQKTNTFWLEQLHKIEREKTFFTV